MREIEKGMIEAIDTFKPYKKDNTQVSFYSEDPEIIRVNLHGSLICEIVGKEIRLNDCGYQTVTTKSRLNVILSHFGLPSIYAKKCKWYIGDEEWEGTKTFEVETK